MTTVPAIKIRARSPIPGQDSILTPGALGFVGGLHREFESRRQDLLRTRSNRQGELDAGARFEFLPSTAGIRAAEWTVPPPPHDLADRRVEITGPVERKMMINALNSGASVFMADFEDSLTPTWANLIEGQVNLCEAVRGTISFTSTDGREYRLGDEVATLIVRPRGWHLVEKHLELEGAHVSGSLFDFGLYAFHNAAELVRRGSGPYFYLPKLESHLEARLWNDVFVYAEEALGLARGTIRATVLVETLPAAFEVEEILYELREHSTGCNAGRWDYIFSCIKKLRNRPDFILPDRQQVTMIAPFMRAYCLHLLDVCHRRGAHAIGGMAAFIPSRRDADVNSAAVAKVTEDKLREASDGFDGTWVAHPDLVPVARKVFDSVLGDAPNQMDRGIGLSATADDLVAFEIPGSAITEAGLRNNVAVALQYIESWLRGTGAVALYNLMEDAATAEIARAQVWQWLHNGATLSDGRAIDITLVQSLLDEEMDQLTTVSSDDHRYAEARDLFEKVALAPTLPEFLTLGAYELID